MFTTAEVAAELKVNAYWIRREVRRGRVTPMRLGDSKYAEMRFTDTHVKQLYDSLQPLSPAAKTRRGRRRRLEDRLT